jgi:hypothetical protein
MDLASILLFLALLLLVALFVARPLLQDEDWQSVDEHGAQLAAERERVLDALADLDSDWELGKVPEEIYTGQRAQLVGEGAAVLKAIEEYQPAPSSSKEIGDAKLEALIAARTSKRKKARK